MKRGSHTTIQYASPGAPPLEQASSCAVPPQEELFSIKRLREIEEKIDSIANEFHQKQIADPEKIILDHFEFLALFKISRRTSQNWRLKGRIAYSLIGGRIYFTLADIQKLIQDHKHLSIRKEHLSIEQ